MMKKGAQATIEVIVLMSAFFLMLTIFFFIATNQIQQNVESQQRTQTSLLLDSLKSEIQNVYFLGPGSVREIYFDFPESIDFENSLIEDTYLLLNIYGSDIIVNTNINLRGDWPNTPGRKKLTLIAYPNYVGINTQFLDFSPKSINQTINQGFSKDFNLKAKNFLDELKTYELFINFESDFAQVTSSSPSEISFEANEEKEIIFELSCSNDASGNYSGEIIFISDVNSILPININCVSSQKNLTIFPNNIFIDSNGEEFVEEFLVCNNSQIDFSINNVEVTGSLRDVVAFSFSGNIESNKCRKLELNFLEHFPGTYIGQLNVSASGLMATSSITLENTNLIEGYYFSSVEDDSLSANYFSSYFIKQNSLGSFIPTGELDWNIEKHFDTQRMYFDGVDDNVSLPNSIDFGLNGASEIKFEAKFIPFPNTLSSSLFVYYVSSSAGNPISINTDGFVTMGGRSTGSDSYQSFISNLQVNYGEINHVVGIWDFSNNKFKIQLNNGTMQEYIPTWGSNTLNVSNPELSNIGSIPTTTGRMKGSIYDVNIYKDGVLLSSYIGKGNTNADWVDQVGSNNGVVNGNPQKVYFNEKLVDDGLVAYYKFNEVSGTTVFDSVNMNNGNLVGGASINAKGMWDSNALSLNGSNSVTTNFGSGLNPYEEPISITAWVKSNDPGSNKMAFSFGDGTGSNQRGYFAHHNGRWNMGVGETTWGTLGNVFATSNWTHLAIVLDQGVGKMYANGELTRQLNYSSFNFHDNFGFGIYSSVEWDGLIDEVKIYDRALSEEEVLADYNNSSNSKFTKEEIIDFGNPFDFNNILINKNLYYDFGNPIESHTKNTSKTSELTSNHKLFDDSLIGLWNLNDNAVDSSGNGNDGVWSGTESYAQGLWGTSAGEFDGSSSFISVNDDDIFTFSDAKFSISSWVKFNSINNSSETMIVSKTSYADNQREFGFGLTRPSNSLCEASQGGGFSLWLSNTLSANWIGVCNNVVPKLNVWYHVVATIENGVGNIYVDGKLVKSRSNLHTSITNGNANLVIGGTNNDGTPIQIFNGKIEEVAIWDRALTQDEVEHLYLSQAGNFKEPNLVGLWHLDGDVVDSSGNGNDGFSSNTAIVDGLLNDNALYFNGTNSYARIDDVFINNPSKLTISAWFKKIGEGHTYECVLHKGTSNTIGSTEYWLGVDNADNLTATIGASTGVGWAAGRTNIKAELGRWYHLVASWNGSIVRVYVNGAFVKQYNLTNYTSSANPTRFGASTDGDFYQFNGVIEEVAIWEDYLDEDEVRELYTKFVNKIDLDIYSCEDKNCNTKLNNVYIENAKNNYKIDISQINPARYVSFDVFFKKTIDSSNNIVDMSKVSFLEDFNISSS